MSDTLQNTIQLYSDGRMALLEPGGNWGDRLIYEGMKKKLDELNVSYYTALRKRTDDLEHGKPESTIRKWGSNILSLIESGIRFKTPISLPKLLHANIDSNTDVILIHGSGGFTLWGGTTQLFKEVVKKYELPVIVAPQSFWFIRNDVTDLVSDISQPVHLFCREPYSQSLLNRFEFPNNVDVSLSPDTAFYLDRDSLSNYIDRALTSEAGEDFELVNFRDRQWSIVEESIREEVLAECDNPFTRDVGDPNQMTFEECISFIDGANRVYTDRLHMAILGVILNKEVTLFEHIFYKSKGVYKYQLSGLDNVTFQDAVR